MTGTDFVNQLRERTVPLGQILLDANNPRLLGMNAYAGVPENRIPESGVQRNVLNMLNSTRAFDMDSLRASIESSGLLPVDRIVVRPLQKTTTSSGEQESDDARVGEEPDANLDTYVVVEGNRRIAACKTLLEFHESGQKTLRPEVLASIEAPGVLILQESDAEEARLDQWVIQGVRHISGIRQWGAFQAAKTIEAMVTKLGYAEGDVASALSITIQRVRRSLKVLAALRQMGESDDYAEHATPEMYAYFDEVIKRPAVRKWLGWSDDSMSFEQDDNLNNFYGWITPDDELDGRRRISVAEGVRRLDGILEDQAAVEVLNTPGMTVEDALKVAAPETGPDWTEPLQRAIKALDNVPISDLERLDPQNKELIQQLMSVAEKRLRQAEVFSSTE